MEYATIEAFRSDPEKVWRFYGPRISMLTEAEPNAAHHALAELEELGLVAAVVTQNIDLLHARAGSREVIEVHGSIRTCTCPHCGASHSLERVLAMLEERPDDAPRCASCAAVLKPDVVFFGELLPERAMERAYELARAAGVHARGRLVARGPPVAGLPHETLARRRQLAIVNLGPTPFDGQGGGEDRGERGGGASGGRANPQAAVRLTGRSSRTSRQEKQKVRSTSYGMPLRWRSTTVVTGVCS